VLRVLGANCAAERTGSSEKGSPTVVAEFVGRWVSHSALATEDGVRLIGRMEHSASLHVFVQMLFIMFLNALQLEMYRSFGALYQTSSRSVFQSVCSGDSGGKTCKGPDTVLATRKTLRVGTLGSYFLCLAPLGISRMYQMQFALKPIQLVRWAIDGFPDSNSACSSLFH